MTATNTLGKCPGTYATDTRSSQPTRPISGSFIVPSGTPAALLLLKYLFLLPLPRPPGTPAFLPLLLMLSRPLPSAYLPPAIAAEAVVAAGVTPTKKAPSIVASWLCLLSGRVFDHLAMKACIPHNRLSCGVPLTAEIYLVRRMLVQLRFCLQRVTTLHHVRSMAFHSKATWYVQSKASAHTVTIFPHVILVVFPSEPVYLSQRLRPIQFAEIHTSQRIPSLLRKAGHWQRRSCMRYRFENVNA